MLAEFCISSLVIVCLVKSFYELNIRFFGPAVSAGAASKRSNRFFAPERGVASAGLAFKRAAEAGQAHKGVPARKRHFFFAAIVLRRFVAGGDSALWYAPCCQRLIYVVPPQQSTTPHGERHAPAARAARAGPRRAPRAGAPLRGPFIPYISRRARAARGARPPAPKKKNNRTFLL